VGFRSHTSVPGADLPRHQEDSRRSHPGEDGPSQQDLTLSVSEKTAERRPGFFGAKTSPWSMSSATRPPCTPVHIDCRLETTTGLYLTPPIIYKG
jgi:hypothetical protein